jgi:sodium-dependent dicarboxylate transporter 2/3/5
MPEEPQAALPRHRLAGLVLGPALAVAMLLGPVPDGLSPQGWATAAVGVWMAAWWMTEALPLAVTALLPIMLFPLLADRGVDATAAAYANPLVFLFLGGFLMARAMHVWQLDRRLALTVLRFAGTRPRRVIAGVMAVTAFLSMWVSNTATAMVMLPIALSILPAFQPDDAARKDGFAPALLLGIAYAATIGGMGTIIGTPPNALFAAYMAETHQVTIDFRRWMLIGVPAVLILLPLAWVVLTRVAFRIPATAPTSAPLPPPAGPMTRPEWMLAVLMVLVASCWILRPLLNAFVPLTDAGIAMTGAILCFLLPVDLKSGRFLLSWDEAMNIRWDVLILFGGGLSLAGAIADTDLSAWLGTRLAGLGTLPVFLLLLVIGVLIVGVGELASNTAMAAVFLPVAGATALGMGEPAYVLALPVALFATLGFMLPAGTPPNAVIFGSGAVEMRHMLRAGIILDLAGIPIVAGIVLVLGDWVLAS